MAEIDYAPDAARYNRLEKYFSNRPVAAGTTYTTKAGKIYHVLADAPAGDIDVRVAYVITRGNKAIGTANIWLPKIILFS